ncbi:hypothetical protein RIF25_08410 [Thermosynechococcaceae cyanobacterium BACA0444]|uniref:Uncharacterized protein n=1 Tax=Pseudocalidococcus azoricus BACA0444 TaxID=2918990 RepID=A0AAE4JVY0_9CYAN|nr:hypothetical protein [Pseudocalidococcus azoricus]MDS3860835.1 hypothetical protein [Pseudocalidococcus azoricus BACA0444]
MTELLEQAIAQLRKLAPIDQDAIAARFLAEIEDEQHWNRQFEATTEDQWTQIAAMVRQEISRGEINPLSEIFPVCSDQ